MRIAVLFNPSSGRGKGADSARECAAACERAGIHAEARSVREVFAEDLRGLDAVAVAGGDGTLHHSLPMLLAAQVPVYHLPLGTENLFAREYGHSASPSGLVDALRAMSVVRVDVPELASRDVRRRFVIMTSVGPDAGLIHRVNANRTGPITHADYAKHLIGEAFEARLPVISVRVDGAERVVRQRGMVVVANSRHYALGINLAHEASMVDGLVDAVFVPAAGALGVAVSMVASLARGVLPVDTGVQLYRGTRIEIEASGENGPWPLQADGEAIEPGLTQGQDQPGRLEVRMPTDRLPVLVPFRAGA
jgi:diacylglycerol kinase (ATP)